MPCGHWSSEEYTIGHNAGTSATRLKHPYKEGHKEKFGLRGLGDGGQRLADDFLVERSGKRRIGQTEGIAVASVLSAERESWYEILGLSTP